jgi:phosphate:Na+ symporter
MEGNVILITLTLIGALGFFIYGMKVMSEGIQKVAGAKMREILQAMTSNRVTGVLTGFFTTSIIQSSSATTVMVVSFVNAGLLSLRQSIGVIMGANIGTTATAWIISFLGLSKFSIATLSLPILAFAVPMMFFKPERIKSLGEFLVGFALLFMGLEALKASVPELSAEDLAFLKDYADGGIGSTLLFVLIGTLLTIVVQSSSAAMALTLVMCTQGLPFELAAAIVLGENIGTTITANLAALIANTSAKRAARAHLVFNLFGVLWMLFVFQFFLDGVGSVMEDSEWGGPYNADGSVNEKGVTKSLALFHTSFNIINCLIMIWFIPFIEKVVIRMVKGKEGYEDYKLEFIGDGTIRTPELALLEARKEVAKFGKITGRINGFVSQLLVEPNQKERDKLLERIKKYEEITDRVELEVANYLLKVSEGNLSEEASRRVRSMLSIVNDLETIGDIYYQISKAIERKISEKLYFTPEQRENIQQLLKKLDEAFELMNENLHLDTEAVDIDKAMECEASINHMRDELKVKHLQSVGRGDYHVKSGMIYSELISSCEKVGDHIMNVNNSAKDLS